MSFLLRTSELTARFLWAAKVPPDPDPPPPPTRAWNLDLTPCRLEKDGEAVMPPPRFGAAEYPAEPLLLHLFSVVRRVDSAWHIFSSSNVITAF